MTTLEERPRSKSDLIDELRSWLETNWDPDLTVGEWWDRLGMSGWAAPMLPTDCYGKGMSRGDAMAIGSTIARFGALTAPVGMSISMAAPTIATHGTREQIERLLPPAVTGRVHYCQLFSEPGAGSDLAGLATKAVRDGDVWIVNGQKVWTSGAQFADLGMLIARTAPDVPKHQGITWFSIPMQQPGIEIRPLKEMTGHAVFNEVFMTDAQVHDDDRIGETNNGWAAANTTLLHERSGMAARGGGVATTGFARAGGIAGDLDKRAGDFVRARPSIVAISEAPSKRKVSSPAQNHIDLAREYGKIDDPHIRQRIAQAHILSSLTNLNTERQKALRAAGSDLPGFANFGKMLMGDIVRHNRDLGLEILGARGMLHVYDDSASAVSPVEDDGSAGAVAATSAALRAQALPIFGGTDQIQRNIVGERILGLPKEPGDLSKLPFNQLPTNG